VTLIDPVPAEGPSLLETLIAASHLRLADLVREAARAAPTEGVLASIDAQLAHDVHAHLAVIDEVLGGDVDGRQRQALALDRDRLEHALDGYMSATPSRAAALTQLGARLDAHIAEEQRDLLPALCARVGRRRVATLGYRYSAMADQRLG
jgi:hypothetical protein